MYIKRTGTNCQGLFGYAASGSTIENVGIEGDVTGNVVVGILVGHIDGNITNCYTTGSVKGQINGLTAKYLEGYLNEKKCGK